MKNRWGLCGQKATNLYGEGVFRYKKPGGRFVDFNNNPFEVFHGERCAQYGFRKIMDGGNEGGEVIYKVNGMTDAIVNYYLSPRTHERAFLESGLELEWIRVMLNPSNHGDSYWDDFFEDEPPFIAMVGRKTEHK